jgi:PBP1b-binding outer membrane lipoprotein LpoB
MKSILIITTLFLAGCATNPDVEKSVSRDKTMDNIAKKSLINEMINSPDPTVRLEGARIAKEFIAPKKRLFDF